ncbi:hypothetical protein D3C85_1465490 [compost metagenome]
MSSITEMMDSAAAACPRLHPNSSPRGFMNVPNVRNVIDVWPNAIPMNAMAAIRQLGCMK